VALRQSLLVLRYVGMKRCESGVDRNGLVDGFHRPARLTRSSLLCTEVLVARSQAELVGCELGLDSQQFAKQPNSLLDLYSGVIMSAERNRDSAKTGFPFG